MDHGSHVNVYCLKSLYINLYMYKVSCAPMLQCSSVENESSFLCGSVSQGTNSTENESRNLLLYPYILYEINWNCKQIIYFCRIFFQQSDRICLTSHISCSLSWWRIMCNTSSYQCVRLCLLQWLTHDVSVLIANYCAPLMWRNNIVLFSPFINFSCTVVPWCMQCVFVL